VEEHHEQLERVDEPGVPEEDPDRYGGDEREQLLEVDDEPPRSWRPLCQPLA
jgi:hypothetical protein